LASVMTLFHSECLVAFTVSRAKKRKRRRFCSNCYADGNKVTSQLTPWRWFISVWVIATKRSTGWKPVIASTTALISDRSVSILFSLSYMVIRDSKRWPKKSFQPRNSKEQPRRNEQFLFRAKAAQCLQGRSRVRGSRMAADSNRHAGISVLRN